MFKFRKRQGSFLIVAAITAAVLTAAVGFSITKMYSANFRAMSYTKNVIQAGLYASSEADLLRVTKYGDIVKHDKSRIGDTQFFKEIKLDKQTSFGGTVETTNVVINIYHESSPVPMATYTLSVNANRI